MYRKNILTIGTRLLEERKRLKLSQTVMAAHAGLVKVTQINYEKDESCPNADYLSKVAELGVDVQYVITGRRGLVPSVPEAVENQELLAERGISVLKSAHGQEVELTSLGLMWLLNYEAEHPETERRSPFGAALLGQVAGFSPKNLRALNIQAVQLHPYGNKRFHYLVIYLDRTPPTPFMVAPVAGLQTRMYLDEAFVNELPIRLQVSEIQPSPVLVLSQDEVRRLKDGAVLRCTAQK